MSDHGITLPPLPNRALRPGAGDDAMTDYARAAVLLDRQQRPSVECPMCCAEVVRVAGAYDTPAPSAEPVLTVRRVDGEWVVAHCGQEDNFGKTLTINFDALGVVGCESLDKVQVQPTAPSAEPAIAVVTSSSSLQASISWTLNPLPVGTELYESPPDHTAVMRQALGALNFVDRALQCDEGMSPQRGKWGYSRARIGDAKDALNKALEGKR